MAEQSPTLDIRVISNGTRPSAAFREVLDALESCEPVSFRFADGLEAAGAVVLAPDASCSGLDDPDIRDVALTLIAPLAAGAEPPLRDAMVRFADEAEVPWPFRGRAVEMRLPAPLRPLTLDPGEAVLASSDAGPIWAHRRQHGRDRFRSALPLGEGLPEDVPRGLMRLLPLIELSRKAAGPARLENPPLRAAFIIDDPNLHWPRYGFVDFGAIAAHAARVRYHVAFATIPLDAWLVHPGTAQLFRESAGALSLLVHGNNHARDELARRYAASERDALLGQSLARVELLERKAGLNVCRVMVPPHGACAEAVLEALPRHGFEAACVSAGSLRAHNVGRPWTRHLGVAPSETVAGCPVLPRWALAASSDALLRAAAYLGQPLILRGHHTDLKDGLDVFGHLADAINALGDVQWGPLSALCRANYRWRRSGSVLHVRPLGLRAAVDLPDGVEELRLDGRSEGWQVSRAAGRSAILAADGASGSGRVDFVRHTITAARASHAGPAPRTRSALVLRRLLTEARDRLLVS